MGYLSPELLTDIFTLRKNPYNIMFVSYNLTKYLKYSQYSENPRLAHFRVDAIAFLAGQLWQKLPIAIKTSSSLETFKAKTKLHGCYECRCNQCNLFIAKVYVTDTTAIFFNF